MSRPNFAMKPSECAKSFWTSTTMSAVWSGWTICSTPVKTCGCLESVPVVALLPGRGRVRGHAAAAPPPQLQRSVDEARDHQSLQRRDADVGLVGEVRDGDAVYERNDSGPANAGLNARNK